MTSSQEIDSRRTLRRRPALGIPPVYLRSEQKAAAVERARSDGGHGVRAACRRDRHAGRMDGRHLLHATDLLRFFRLQRYGHRSRTHVWLPFPRNSIIRTPRPPSRSFWRRWHISLSGWFRDYLYFPLGGSRGSSGRTAVNLMITFLVSGLWHGAGWHYVVWGAIHGSYQVAGRGIRYVSEAVQKRLPEKKIRFFSEKNAGTDTRCPDLCDIYSHGFCVGFFSGQIILGRAVAMLRRIVQKLATGWDSFPMASLFGMGLCRLEVCQLALAIGVLL